MAKTRKPLKWTDDDFQKLIGNKLEYHDATPTFEGGPQYPEATKYDVRFAFAIGVVVGLTYNFLIQLAAFLWGLIF